jgi:hypothetical protein
MKIEFTDFEEPRRKAIAAMRNSPNAMRAALARVS